jgi:peptide/nickel transport system ATP-binding protein
MAVAPVSHELHLIAAHTDTVHLLEDGRLVRHGPTAELIPSWIEPDRVGPG